MYHIPSSVYVSHTFQCLCITYLLVSMYHIPASVYVSHTCQCLCITYLLVSMYHIPASVYVSHTLQCLCITYLLVSMYHIPSSVYVSKSVHVYICMFQCIDIVTLAQTKLYYKHSQLVYKWHYVLSRFTQNNVGIIYSHC